MKKYMWIGMTLVLLLSSGCVSSNDIQENVTASESVKLLFAYSPGCPHCTYQRPIIGEFEKKHPEIGVTWVIYNDLNDEQRRLIKNTIGHPVMVFYSGSNLRQVVGETSLESLENELEIFKNQLGKTEGSITSIRRGGVCQ